MTEAPGAPFRGLFHRLCAAAFLCAFAAACTGAEPRPGAAASEVQVESAGRFQPWEGAGAAGLPPDAARVRLRGTLRTSVMAIGAETTGVTLRAGGRDWELQLPPELLERAEGWNDRFVAVEGRLAVRAGVELRRRTVVEVSSVVRVPDQKAR